MKSSCAVLAVFPLLIAVSITESRKDLAGEYWRNVMKDQPMPMAIHGLIAHNSDSLPQNDKTKSNEKQVNPFTDEFKPIPDTTAYPDDHKAETKTGIENHFRHHANAFNDQFKPILHVTAYPDDGKSDTKTGAKHHFRHHANAFTDEFEPSPNVSAYPDDHTTDSRIGAEKTTTSSAFVASEAKETKPFTEEFEPSPNVSAYNE